MMDNANWFAGNLNKDGCWLFTNDVDYSKGKTLKAPFCEENSFTVVGHLTDGRAFYEELAAKQDKPLAKSGYTRI